MQDRAEQKDKSQENQNLTFLFGEMKHGGSREGKPVGFRELNYNIHELIRYDDQFFNIFSRQMQLDFLIGENNFF